MRFTFYFCVIALGYSILVSCYTIDGIGRDLSAAAEWVSGEIEE